MSSLKEQKKILKNNIKMEKNKIKKGQTYTNLRTGDTFGTSHYKKALNYDKKQLAKVNAKIALKSAGNIAKKAVNSTVAGKVAKVTQAGLSAYKKKKK